MRMRYWSSDVCSSDLLVHLDQRREHPVVVGGCALAHDIRQAFVVGRPGIVHVVEPEVHEPGPLGMLGDEVDRHIGVKPGEVGLELPEKNGTASCRGRGCPYV